MREIHTDELRKSVAHICKARNYVMAEDYADALRKAIETETSGIARQTLRTLLENADMGREEQVPICQDTGMAIVVLEVGQDVHFTGPTVKDAINKGVAEGYETGYLRKSVVGDPVIRKNTLDNTPAIIHYELVPGDRVTMKVMLKGFGAEMMSQVAMLTPADGIEGVKNFVVKVVEEAGPNPCPPVQVGVGLGGSFELVTYLAKKALFRPIGTHHPAEHIAKLEREFLDEINKLGIGPAGFGGDTTAVWVSIEPYATHIAALPVAVNMNCAAPRHFEVTF